MRTDRIGRYAFGGAAILMLVVVGARYGTSKLSNKISMPALSDAQPDVGSVVAANPTDPHSWVLLGEQDFALGHYAQAARSYARATALDPRRAASWSALGEAMTLAGRAVTDDALHAFQRALVEDPNDARARYFIGVRQDLMGNHAQAIETWAGVLKTSPPDAPWVDSIRNLILTVGKRYGITAAEKSAATPAAQELIPEASIASAGIPGPSPEQMTAAARLNPSEQNEMARAMVAKLAARLDTQPRDAAGWIRLMRAYSVLGDHEKAKQAFDTAKGVFSKDVSTLAQLKDAAEILRL